MATTQTPSGGDLETGGGSARAGRAVGKAARRKIASPAQTTAQTTAGTAPDAIALLTGDHREVEAMFERYTQLDDEDEKLELAENICLALIVHTRIEEEIFYPVYRTATGDDDKTDEAIVEHQAAKDLIEQIEAMEPEQALYDAKVKVLSEEIAHHVKEEEEPGDGMFAKARAAKMDLADLGRQMADRKQALLEELAGD